MSSTVAVLGVADPLGRALLDAFATAGAPIAERLLAIDGRTPDMPPPSAEVRVMDVRDRLLPLTLDGVDVVVHAAFATDPTASPDTLYGANVGGTRNVLDAAAKAGIGHLVVLSAAEVYGARDDNPLPLTEDAPLRANPGYAYAYQRQLVEEMVAEWAGEHPSTTVTVLRTAPVIGSSTLSARLLAPRLVVPVGQGAPWQVVAAADVATAAVHVVTRGLSGTYNVACDGWLSAQEVAAVIGRPLLEVGETVLTECLTAATRLGVAPLPPEAVPLLLHPTVLDVTRLHDVGWRAASSNVDVLGGFARANADVLRVGPLELSRGGVRRIGAVMAGLTLLAVVRLVRR